MKDKGITLIALVITIVLIIILATISVNMIIKDDGIINKAESAQNIQKMAEEKERLELIKTSVAIDNKGKVPLDKYIEELIKEGIAVEDEIEDNEDGSKQVTTDNGYSVNIKQDGEYNVIITVEGKADSLPVRIVNVQLETSTNSIKVDVEVKRGEGATYKYYYKTENTEYKLAHEGKELSYTIGKLEQNVTYTIKVEAINENGTVYKETVGRTGEVQSAVGTIEFGNLSWNNGQAEVTITKNTNDNLEIQYQVLDEELNVVKLYQEISSGDKITGLNLGEIVQARLWDGTNGGSTASLTVIDTTEPNTADIILSSSTTDTSNSITATITQSDSQSGVNIQKCKWVLNTDSADTIDETLYPSENTFDIESQDTIIVSATTPGTYYLHVLTIDRAGNTTQTKSTAIIIEETNVAPVISEVSYSAKTTSSITVKATATDANEDSLTYKLYTSTSETGTFDEKAIAQANSGTQVTLTASDLSDYTTYYYYVTVTDEQEIATSSSSSVRTYCPGTGLNCSTGYISTLSCSTCSGNGKVTCGNHYVSYAGENSYVNTGNWFSCYNENCDVNYTIGKGDTYYKPIKSCTNCGYILELDQEHCSIECARSTNENSTYWTEGCSNKIDCSSCEGSGKITKTVKCTHGYTESHSYCSHNYTSQH